MAYGKEGALAEPTSSDLGFGPFRLKGAKQLWRGEQLVNLRPRPLAVLRYLAERPGRLVSSEELLKRLWPGIYVTKTVLRVCVREIRQALGEHLATPQFIETVGRQGYQFIASIVTTPPVLSSQFSVLSAEAEGRVQQLTTDNGKLAAPFVGREPELAQLHASFARARQGERQVMFILGEVGIGKTTVVDRFLEQILQGAGDWRLETSPSFPHAPSLEPPAPSLRIGRGQCVEQQDPQEAYLPLLEALGQLCQEPGGEQVRAVLRRYAPLWLVQLGGVLEVSELEALQRQVQSASRERMLRELAEAIEVLTAEAVVVLVLEDLQWSDAATLEVLAYLAQRRRQVRLQVLGTYRPVEVVVKGRRVRRLVQELYGRRQCEEVVLELFSRAEVEEYLEQRFGRSPAVRALSEPIYHCTDGNALFVVNFVDYLLQHGLLIIDSKRVELRVEGARLQELVPDTLQRLITRQIEGLKKDEQQLLRVASVAGMTFTTAEMVEVGGHTLEEVEEVYDALASTGRFIEVEGIAEWPEGTVTSRYAFRHALYRQVLYEQLGQGRRIRLHRLLGTWKEAKYGDRAVEIAGELARHFAEGRDYYRAVQYHCQAGEFTLRRSAYREAIDHCQKGLELLERWPDTPERQRQELALRMTLYPALTATRGFGAEELVDNLSRARELCQVFHDDATLVSVLVGLGRSYAMRADREATETLVDEELRLLNSIHEPTLAIQLHTQLGTSHLWRGAYGQAQEHYARVLELYDPQRHRDLVLLFGMDPAVVAHTLLGWSLWVSGWSDQARVQMQQGLSLAKGLGHPYSLSFALIDAAHLQLWCGDRNEAGRLAEKGATLAREHGITLYRVRGDILQACIHVQCGEPEVGLSMLAEGLAQYREMGALYFLPLYLCFAADAYQQLGRVDEGLATVVGALRMTETNLDVFWEAELHRRKGELLLNAERMANGKEARPKLNDERRTKRKGRESFPIHHSAFIIQRSAEAEACCLKALAIARRQSAKSLELRAALSLSRLWQQQGKRAEAYTLLAEIYGWFTEGFDTQDLQEAKALLDVFRA